MTEEPKLTEQDEADIAAMLAEGETAPKRSLLTLWAEILSNIEAAASMPITIHVAANTVARWPSLKLQDTQRYHELYHRYLLDVRHILKKAISEHPDNVDFVGEEDAAENHDIYRAILVEWHLLIDDLETEWRAEWNESHIMLACIADVRAFIFSQTGLAGHLDTIGFTMSDDEFKDAVMAAKEERGE